MQKGVCPIKIKVIMNPKSGRRVIQKNLEIILGRLLLEGTAEQISVSPTKARGDARDTAARLQPGEFDLVIGCGGDGTINEILHGLMQGGCGAPLAILAAGTSNDFAYSMKLPQDPEEFCRMVQEGQQRLVDVGMANGRYFINVASFGAFTEIAHSTQQDFKGVLGKLAYYLTGVWSAPEQLATLVPVRISSPEHTMEAELRLCLIANSMSVGSIRWLMHKADVSDGKFDVLLVKKKPLLPKDTDFSSYILNGDFLNDPAIQYFQTDSIRIESLDEEISRSVELDVDGEFCGHLPLEVRVLHKALPLLVPRAAAAAGGRSTALPM
ncbi:MAG: diacylglycerol kinase family lipid kinase [Bacillota bacterium]|nr:diacylglycerol kinase family lipid kinase [Bacillota bacterium]